MFASNNKYLFQRYKFQMTKYNKLLNPKLKIENVEKKSCDSVN